MSIKPVRKTLNQRARGSSPRSPTIENKGIWPIQPDPLFFVLSPKVQICRSAGRQPNHLKTDAYPLIKWYNRQKNLRGVNHG